MICSANLAFAIYPGLTHGAYVALDTLRKPSTEGHLPAQAGRRRLERHHVPDRAPAAAPISACSEPGRCPTTTAAIAITGTKIFISAGEHDLTENIVHLVLARLPDAPRPAPRHQPVRGAEVPAQGRRRCRRAKRCLRRHRAQDGHQRLGHLRDAASRAQGFLVGELNSGMRAMFTMMNNARLAVGLQGLALAETAYQSAVATPTSGSRAAP